MKYFLVFLFVSIKSYSFTTIGPGIKGYANPEITFDYNSASCPSNIDIRSIMLDSVKVWNKVGTSKIKINIGSDVTHTTRTYPPVAYCDSTMTGFASGVGGSNWDSSGVLVAGSLRLNTNPASTSAIFNFQYSQIIYVTAHEVGHVLGLGHSEKDYALMSYTFENQSNLALSQDDIDGITYLYARNELSGDKMMGCGLVKNLPPPPPSTKLILGFILIMPVLIYFRLRIRRLKKINKSEKDPEVLDLT